MIKIYNTITRKKELFDPIHEKRVKMFVCGPTVYDDSHIGHARTYIVFDVIARYLKYRGFSIFYLQNITDIDDKIIKRASELGIDPISLARKFEKRYFEDMDALEVLSVNLYARATEHLPEIIKQIKTLIDKGFAYETETGVYFDESKFRDFGKLSGRKIDDLTIHRIEPDPTKRNPGDFSLWKKRENKPLWDSPWGKGRPGWHIEDTAITENYFGPQYDVHGGGLDLIFPHHEAEIAQMESASGTKPMVKYWIHTGFLNVEGEKMSKSLGNFITIRKLLNEHDPEVFRFFVLSTHYRSPIDFSEDALFQSKKSLRRVLKFIDIVEEQFEEKIEESNQKDEEYRKKLHETKKLFLDAMDNDFNTPIALSILFNFIRDVNRDIDKKLASKGALRDVKKLILEFGNILGLDFSPKDVKTDLTNDLLDIIVDVRQKLRDKKYWELSDEIRSRLKNLGIILEDK